MKLTLITIILLTSPALALTKKEQVQYRQGYIDGYNRSDETCNERWLIKYKALKYRYQYWDSVRKVEPKIQKFNQDFDKRKGTAK